MFCARAVGRYMVERRYGRIINIASMLGVVGMPERTPYASSKGGLILFTRTLALEWASHNVLVNAICPGPFATEMNRPLLASPEKSGPILEAVPLKRFAEPEELVGAAIYLASDASSFVTGSTIFVDGGYTAR
jgi:NAD(P)-dependent dehydrogenase (short-subunit alcohol dehydrogenase family)